MFKHVRSLKNCKTLPGREKLYSNLLDVGERGGCEHFSEQKLPLREGSCSSGLTGFFAVPWSALRSRLVTAAHTKEWPGCAVLVSLCVLAFSGGLMLIFCTTRETRSL